MKNHYQIFTKKFEEYLKTNNQFMTENLKTVSGIKIAFSGPRLVENLFQVDDITPLLGLNRYNLYKVFKQFRDVLEKLEIRPLIVFDGINCNNYDKKYMKLLHYYPNRIWENIANNKIKEAKELIN